jgi:hypothetical protein
MDSMRVVINFVIIQLALQVRGVPKKYLWVANWQIWHESPLWCSLVQIGQQDSFQLMRDLLPVTSTAPVTGTSSIQVYQATDFGLNFQSAP